MTDRNRPAHTPGPWRLDGMSAHRVVGPRLEPVADCSRDSTHPAVEDRCAANARLIAAAPETAAELERSQNDVTALGQEVASLHNELARVTAERDALLEAARDGDDFIDRNLRWGEMDEKARVDLKEARKRLRAAIARAEGRE